MKILMNLLIILFLGVNSSCRHFPTTDVIEVCAINVSGNYCRCNNFDFNYGKLESVGNSVNKPMDYCHKKIGMSGPGWIKLIHYLDSIYVWKNKSNLFKNNKTSRESSIMNFNRSRSVGPETRNVPLERTPLNLLEDN